MKLTLIIPFSTIILIALFCSCNMASEGVNKQEDPKLFQFEEDGKIGFKNADSKIVIDPILESARKFSEGYAAVEINGKWGLIDKNGKYVIRPMYNDLGNMHNGMMSCKDINGKYGFINIDHVVIVPPRYDSIGEYAEGFYVFRNEQEQFGFLNKEGEIAIEAKYSSTSNFENGRAKVQLNNDWLHINTKGEVVKEK